MMARVILQTCSAKKSIVLTVTDTGFIFSLPRTSPRNITAPSRPHGDRCNERGSGSDFDLCEMPGETLRDNCFKKRWPPFSALGGKYTDLSTLALFWQGNSYHS